VSNKLGDALWLFVIAVVMVVYVLALRGC